MQDKHWRPQDVDIQIYTTTRKQRDSNGLKPLELVENPLEWGDSIGNSCGKTS